jgi:hypothetical protein
MDLHNALRHPIPIPIFLSLCLISSTREEEIEGEEGWRCCFCYSLLAFSKILILVVRRRAGAGASTATTWGQENPESHQGRKLFSALLAAACDDSLLALAALLSRPMAASSELG